MAAAFGMVLAPWDYAADNGQLLERAAGETGLDHLTTLAISGPVQQFRLGCAPESPQFDSAGGWHFPPGAKLYASSGLRPAKARWFGTADVLARMRAHAGRLGLGFVPRVDLGGIPALVEHEPHIVQRNAWRQDVVGAGACPVNPDLRELVRAAFQDLMRYEPAAIELVGWTPDRPADRDRPRPLAWHAGVRRLLDICLCPACRQIAEQAGIDAEGAAGSVRTTIEREMTQPAEELATDPLVEAYVEARRHDCRQWLGRLASDTAAIRHIHVQTPDAAASEDECPPWLTLLRVPVAPAAAEALLPGLHAGGVALPAWRPTFADSSQFVRLVQEAARAGVEWFDFEGLAEAGPDAVTWLRQAVRFARRE